jgi:flagellar hook-basal body complex protein FliE
MDTLRNVMDQVGQLQTDAEQQVSSLLHGDGEDVHTAMIAMQKADLSFQLMMQARNKIIDAYQQVSQMQF